VIRLVIILLLLLAACGQYAPTATPVVIPTVDPTPTAEPDPCLADPLPHTCHYGKSVDKTAYISSIFLQDSPKNLLICDPPSPMWAINFILLPLHLA